MLRVCNWFTTGFTHMIHMVFHPYCLLATRGDAKIGGGREVENGMKGKMALLFGLVLLGLVLAGVGNGLGVGKAFRGKPDVLEASLVENKVVISRGGHVIETLTLPEGKEGFSLEVSDRGIHIGYLTREEIKERQAQHEVQLNGWLEIAARDTRFQEVLAGKRYRTVASAESFGGRGKRMAYLMLEIEGEDKFYKVTIDLSSESVVSIEEQEPGSGIQVFDVGGEG